MAPTLTQLLAVSNLITAGQSAVHSGRLSERQQVALAEAIDLTGKAFISASSRRVDVTARSASQKGGEAI
ncbi:hypothetical protein [Bradyrhizobium sp. WSM1743]|uniref:hypothetical protein n=1 Tax=Bradyrhizobium sp. WSM1743 TaxID=318996 RepID=UPI00041105CC|nr:hypothetical protein [Bradyrhizobium sp. WSM1743]